MEDIFMNDRYDDREAEDIRPVKYRKEGYVADRRKKRKRCSTGLLALDNVLSGGLRNELHIMGAESSTGKSALMISLAQNLAIQNVNALYFSLEMSIDAIITRGVCEISFLAHRKDKRHQQMTTDDILFWKFDTSEKDYVGIPYEVYQEYVEQYFEKYGDYLYVFDYSRTGISARKIEEITERFIKTHPGEKTVVFVDYLQILKADKRDGASSDRKTVMDTAVTILESLACQSGVPVFTASSVSRSQYSSQISTGSMKESGNIEYSAGVLIGYNWIGVNDTKDAERQEREIALCDKRGYRKIEFHILKNRDSKTGGSATLFYYPAYNHFEDEYTFHPAEEKGNPFRNRSKEIEGIKDGKEGWQITW